MTSGTSSRQGYIDWARGLAVLIMMEAHAFDSWTRDADRHGAGFGYASILGGFAAPLFLFLAGVGVALSAESKLRRGESVERASQAVQRRGWQILALALLFRLQEYVVNPGGPALALLKVDILNVMGPAIVGAAVVWRVARGRTAATLALAGTATAVAMLTPIVRTAPQFALLPDPLEWYLRPVPGLTSFALFPWAGFVFAGAAAGLWIDAGRGSPGGTAGWLAVAGTLLAGLGYGSSYLPSIYANSSFWTSSPTFFVLRVGIVLTVLPLAYAWELRPRLVARDGWSPLEVLGRSSLFVYWIHVDLVYGLLTMPLHHRLTLGWACVAYALLSLFMYALVVVKNRVVSHWKAGRARRVPGARPLAPAR